MMRTFVVRVTHEVRVVVDETKIREGNLCPLNGVSDHARHLAHLKVTGQLDPFTPGYGWIEDLGIKVLVVGEKFEVSED
jgi:hypothetical protein